MHKVTRQGHPREGARDRNARTPLRAYQRRTNDAARATVGAEAALMMARTPEARAQAEADLDRALAAEVRASTDERRVMWAGVREVASTSRPRVTPSRSSRSRARARAPRRSHRSAPARSTVASTGTGDGDPEPARAASRVRRAGRTR